MEHKFEICLFSVDTSEEMSLANIKEWLRENIKTAYRIDTSFGFNGLQQLSNGTLEICTQPFYTFIFYREVDYMAFKLMWT